MLKRRINNSIARGVRKLPADFRRQRWGSRFCLPSRRHFPASEICSTRTDGFTLLELVVVIAILAVLATIAIRSLEGVEDQTRFDATRTQLASVSSAVVGNLNVAPSDTSGQIFSFVSDIGRLPVAVGSDPATQMQELWSNPKNLPLLAVRQATAVDPDVWLPVGWRGGYLQLGVGQTTLLDGWGNPYDLFYSTPAFSLAGAIAPCADGNPIEIVRSRGADGLVDTAPTTGFNADQAVTFNSLALSSANTYLLNSPGTNNYQATTYQASLSGNVFHYNATTGQVENPTGTVVVLLFTPGGDQSTNYIAAQLATVTTSTITGAVTYSFNNSPSVAPTITVGQRIIRAYEASGNTPWTPMLPINQPPFMGATPAYRSIPLRMTLQPGQQMKDLTMTTTTIPTTQPATQPSGT